jgi:hypothetical protein
MALNWVTMVDARPLLLQGESFIETVDNVKCNLTIPAVSSSSGMSGGLKKLEGVGTMALTDQRVCTSTCTGQTHLDDHPHGRTAHMG